MIKPKISECLYCKRVSIWSTHFKNYVCDDCYEKNTKLKEAELRSYELDE